MLAEMEVCCNNNRLECSGGKNVTFFIDCDVFKANQDSKFCPTAINHDHHHDNIGSVFTLNCKIQTCSPPQGFNLPLLNVCSVCFALQVRSQGVKEELRCLSLLNALDKDHDIPEQLAQLFGEPCIKLAEGIKAYISKVRRSLTWT